MTVKEWLAKRCAEAGYADPCSERDLSSGIGVRVKKGGARSLKAGGAWIILLVDVILSVLELVFALNGGADGTMIVSVGIAIVLNLIAFIAANNVKKQGKR